MVEDAIRDCSRRKAIILDPFLGSGTTLIAAEKTGRAVADRNRPALLRCRAAPPQDGLRPGCNPGGDLRDVRAACGPTSGTICNATSCRIANLPGRRPPHPPPAGRCKAQSHPSVFDHSSARSLNQPNSPASTAALATFTGAAVMISSSAPKSKEFEVAQRPTASRFANSEIGGRLSCEQLAHLTPLPPKQHRERDDDLHRREDNHPDHVKCKARR